MRRVIAGLAVVAAAAFAACFGGEPQLASTAQPVLQADMMLYDFGSVNVGSSGTLNVLITSQTAGDDDTLIDITEQCGDFSLDLNPSPNGYRIWCDTSTGSGAIGSGGTAMCIPNAYVFKAMFMPVGAGSASCTVHVDYFRTGIAQPQVLNLTLRGNGVASQQSLAITPPNGSQLSFGDIPVMQASAGQTVTIRNNGSTTLTVNGSATGPYTITPPPGQVQLSPNGVKSYSVQCNPTGPGSQPGTFSFTSAAPAVGVTMACNGVTPGTLHVAPVPGNFAETTVGRPPADIVLTATNSGGVPTVLTVSLSQTSPELTIVNNPSGMSLGGGSSMPITLHYSAASEHAMGQLGTLVVSGSGLSSASNVVINGAALTAALGVSPGTAIDFGPVCAGAHADQAVTLYASAAGPVTVTSVSAPGTPFTAGPAAGMLMGAHGNEITLMASVAPTAPGGFTDKLVVHTDLATADQNVALAATALPPGVTPTPDTLHFGPSRVDAVTTAKEVKLSNCGTAPLTITGAHVEGANAAEFDLVSALPAAPVAQKEATTFLVVMHAIANGQKQATLVIDYDGGQAMIALDGNGFGAGNGGGGDRTTYYACDAGGPAGFGAALLPLVLILRRRRK